MNPIKALNLITVYEHTIRIIQTNANVNALKIILQRHNECYSVEIFQFMEINYCICNAYLDPPGRLYFNSIMRYLAYSSCSWLFVLFQSWQWKKGSSIFKDMTRRHTNKISFWLIFTSYYDDPNLMIVGWRTENRILVCAGSNSHKRIKYFWALLTNICWFPALVKSLCVEVHADDFLLYESGSRTILVVDSRDDLPIIFRTIA